MINFEYQNSEYFYDKYIIIEMSRVKIKTEYIWIIRWIYSIKTRIKLPNFQNFFSSKIRYLLGI